MQFSIKNINGYEGLYIIDSLGNVVSLPKQNGSRFLNEYKVLKTKVNRTGYVEVTLSKNGTMKTYLLHRLLAIHFLDNPNNYPCVNHKNGIKTDNRLENLEWCTMSQNTKHAYKNNISGFKDIANAGIEKMNYYSQYIHIILVDKENNELCFSSTKEAGKFLNTSADNLSRAIKKQQRCCGYKVFGLKRKDCANGER